MCNRQTSRLITSRQITAQHITHITSHHITTHHITSQHITTHHITSHHITSHHITLHHITSHHITSHHITSHHRIKMSTWQPQDTIGWLWSFQRMTQGSSVYGHPYCLLWGFHVNVPALLKATAGEESPRATESVKHDVLWVMTSPWA